MLKITKNQGSIQVTADKSGFYPFDGTITFPTNSLFTATSANTDMITFKSTSNGDVQFVGNYKDITISGRSYDTKQKFLTAFSNLANQGSVDAYTKAETDAKIDAKQDKLTAGTGIKITKDETTGKTFVNTKLEMDKGPYNSDGISIGRIARLASSGGIAFGDESLSEHSGIAIGHKAQSSGQSTIVIGNNSSDYGTSVCSGVVIGDNARGVGAGVVIGKGAHGGSAGAVIGYNSTVDGNGYGYAIGDNVHISETTEMMPIAIGYGAVADETKPLAITILKISDTDSDGTPEMKYCDFIQGDANGKISLLKGDGTDTRMVIQDEIEALKNAGGGGTVDAYTKTETDTKLEAKQDKLTAGSGITITKDETAGTSTIATAVSLTDNGDGAYQVGNSITIDSNGIAIGRNASPYIGNRSVTIGNLANDHYNISCVVIGTEAQCNDGWSMAIGTEAKALYRSSLAIGGGAQTDSPGSIALGTNAKALYPYSIAIGYNATSNINYGLSIGYGAETNDTTPLVIKAGKDANYEPLTVLQSDSNGKLSILKGDGTDERIVIQDALSAGGSGGGTVDAYTKTETDALLNAKQNTLTAGSGITIDENNVISSTGGTGGSANPLVNVKGAGSATITDSVTDAVAIGSYASVDKISGVAIGRQAVANGSNGVAIGHMSKSMGSSAVAIGENANSMSNKTIAIGENATTTGENTIAIGSGANASSGRPLVIKAGDDGNGAALLMIQGDSTGKISIPLGDGTASTMCLQDEIAALKAEIAALKGGASTGA